MKKLFYGIITLLLGLSLFSCKKDNSKVIVVAASPKPHADILEFVKPLLKEKGYTLKIKRYDDYITPNQALTLKQVDANYFQHVPYLDLYNAENETNIIGVAKIHIEPIGIYSKVYNSLSEVADGAKVLISNSKADHGRLLNLLALAELIVLSEDVDPFQAQISDIVENPKNLKFEEVDPTALTDAYEYNQGDLILINSNFALDAGLSPGEDAIALERPNDNPFANIIATLPEYADSDKIKALVEVLTSSEVAAWILENWGGDIVPFEED